MRKILFVLIGLFALQTAAYAEGQWMVNSQWLFFMPSFDDTYFVSSGMTNDLPSGTRYRNDFGFRPAYRVKVAYGNPECDFHFAVFYTYFYARKNRTIVGSSLFPTDGYQISPFGSPYSGFATAKDQILHHNVDALFCKSLCDPGCFQFNLIFGAEYAFARLLQVTDYSSAADYLKFSRRNRFFGIGPEFGFDLEYKLAEVDWFCRGQINFNFLSLGSLLASKTVARQSNHNSTGGGVSIALQDQNTWRVVPALHTRCGISYDLVFSCIRASIEIGYELNTYLRALTKPLSASNVLNSITNEYTNFSVQGPFGGLNLVF